MAKQSPRTDTLRITERLEDNMHKKLLSMRLAYAGLALWLALIACGLPNTTRVDELKSETQSVDRASASTARVQIQFPAGELKVEGGASSLMDASFRYNVSDWQPQIKYSENGAQGDLLVSQPGDDKLPVGGGLVNEWTIQLADDVPLDLTIITGAGNSELNLGALDLTKLDIQTGAGVTNVDLNGTWQHDLDVSIEGGVGELTVNLPASMGVRVNKETALVNVSADGLLVDGNGYVNRAYGTAPYTLTLKLQAGIGSVVLVAP
jgi:N-terminal domain of toast_rack, DUF2154